ncbi:hypothetical protein RSAG8_02711, partial [Rhizoctonia solani AG-8 WAC10335]
MGYVCGVAYIHAWGVLPAHKESSMGPSTRYKAIGKLTHIIR